MFPYLIVSTVLVYSLLAHLLALTKLQSFKNVHNSTSIHPSITNHTFYCCNNVYLLDKNGFILQSMRALTKAENIETDANILKKNGTALADSIENMLQDLKGMLFHTCDIL